MFSGSCSWNAFAAAMAAAAAAAGDDVDMGVLPDSITTFLSRVIVESGESVSSYAGGGV